MPLEGGQPQVPLLGRRGLGGIDGQARPGPGAGAVRDRHGGQRREAVHETLQDPARAWLVDVVALDQEGRLAEQRPALP